MNKCLTSDFPLCYEKPKTLWSGSREEKFKNHIVVLVVADLESLPALALCVKGAVGRENPPMSLTKVYEAMGSSHGFFDF
jgi:hypothetical protein